MGPDLALLVCGFSFLWIHPCEVDRRGSQAGRTSPRVMIHVPGERVVCESVKTPRPVPCSEGLMVSPGQVYPVPSKSGMMWEKKEHWDGREQLSCEREVSVREGVGDEGVSGKGGGFRFRPLGGPSPDESEE